MRVRRATGQIEDKSSLGRPATSLTLRSCLSIPGGVTVIEGLLSLSAAAGFLAAACWVQVARRIDAIGAMDQRAYRRSLGRAALMTAGVLIMASVAVALGALGVR